MENKRQDSFMFESKDVEAINTAPVFGGRYGEALGLNVREAKARELGQVIVYPTKYELQVDIDTEHQWEIFNAMLPVVSRNFGVVQWITSPSKSGLPRRHVTITLSQEITDIERIALQLCLGSDRMREMLGLIRVMRLKQPNPTCFFETPEKQEPECTTSENIKTEPSKPSLVNSIKGAIGSLLSWQPEPGKPSSSPDYGIY